MFNLKKILVCLDMTKMDEFVIEYAGLLAKTMESDEIYFFHVNAQLEVPSSVREKYPELYGPVADDYKSKMEKAVSNSFPDYKDFRHEFVVREGSPSQKILEWSEIEAMDLIIMGKKSELKGKGVNPKKIANISHCSILFVPERARVSLDTLFVPIDFSIRSTTGVEQAMAIKKHNQAQVILQHVYFVPQGYHYTGKTYDEFAIIMRDNSIKDYNMFMKRHKYDQTNFKDIYTLDDDDAPADKIYLEALNYNADLIILPSRGRTKAASLLLGSVAIELLKFHQRIPYMVIKDKRENMSFFQALMKV